MALDSRIPLMGQPNDYTLDYDKAQNLAFRQQHMRQQNMLNQELVEQRRLQNEERRHQMDAEKFLADSIGRNTKTDDKGNVKVDEDAIERDATAAGYADHFNKWATARRATQATKRQNDAAAIKAEADQFDLASKKAQQRAQNWGPVLNLPENASTADLENAFNQALAQNKKLGLVGDDEQFAITLGPDGKPDLSRFHQEVQGAQTLKEQADALRHAAELANKKFDNAAEKHRAINGLLGFANSDEEVQGALDYAKQWGATDEDLKPFQDIPWSPEQKRKWQVGSMKPTEAFLNPNEEARINREEATAKRADASAAALQKWREENLRLRQEAAKKQDTAEQRQAYSEILKLGTAENKYHTSRRQLGAAIGAAKGENNTGGTFITKSGVAMPMGQAMKEFGESREALIEDMRARYQGDTDALKQVIADKYQQYGRLGVTAPSVPIEEVYKAIDAGDEGIYTAKPVEKKTTATETPKPGENTIGTLFPGQSSAGKLGPKPANTLGSIANPAQTAAAQQLLTQAPESPEAPAAATNATTATPATASDTATIKGKTYKKGDKIKIQGKTYKFAGLDAAGKIQVQ